MFSFKRKPKKHKWKTVAIDTGSVTWHYAVNSGKAFPHILVYQECEHCGARQMEYDDALDEGKTYARNGNSIVAKMRSIWIHSGDIPMPHNKKHIKFIDPKYAPLGDFEKWARAIKTDPEMEPMLKNQMIDDALGQLEVAVKLHVNNQPQDNDDD